MTSLPTALLANNCAACSDLFDVSAISAIAQISTEQAFVQNTQYWFIVTFKFTNIANIIPLFQTLVKINTKYANYFSPIEMSQNVNKLIDPNSLDSVAAANDQRKSAITNNGGSSPVIGTALVNPNAASNPTTNPQLITQLFGG